MATNEGVGKKIVEALKQQTMEDFSIDESIDVTNEAEIFNQENETVGETLSLNQNSIEENSVNNFEITESPVMENSFKEEQKNFVFDSQEDKSINVEPSFSQLNNEGWNFGSEQESKSIFSNPKSYDSPSVKQFEMPANVAVLKKLITQLPTGVTKQTGAQIIKQTMEALGISMHSVLHDAQKVQDEMNDSIKNCMLTIQEYKNNIKNLEKQGLDYQRQVNQLNDLISLFILSDKD